VHCQSVSQSVTHSLTHSTEFADISLSHSHWRAGGRTQVTLTLTHSLSVSQRKLFAGFQNFSSLSSLDFCSLLEVGNHDRECT